MSRRHTKLKVDGNQAEIIRAIEAVGGKCQDLASVGSGCPDVLASFRNKMYLIEIKNPEKQESKRRKLDESQVKWHEKWQAPVHVVETVDEVLKLIGATR